jgi:hypothetical protein
MRKHAPGPWVVSKMGIGIKDTEGNWVGDPCYSVFVNDGTKFVGPSSVACCHLPDARLIAAAPEMLEALEAALSYWNQDRASQQLRLADVDRILKSAIAKAKGES